MSGGREGEARKEELLHPKLRSVECLQKLPCYFLSLLQVWGELQHQLPVSAVVLVWRIRLCVCCGCPSR